MSSNIVEYLYQDRDKQQANIASGIAPAAKSNYGIYESDFDLLDRDHSGIKSLKAFIGDDALQQTVSHVNGGVVPPERIENEFRDSWYHITNNAGFHDAHVHGGCSWCGIFYLQAGESGQRVGAAAPNGGNRFYSPHWTGGAYSDYGNQYLANVYVDPPIQDGTLLLFPSFLKHSGLPYRGKTDRVIISFNSRSNVRPERLSVD